MEVFSRGDIASEGSGCLKWDPYEMGPVQMEGGQRVAASE